MSDGPRVIVVGGGLAGLAASIRVAESGVAVDLFSMTPVKRSHSVCAQGGINACNEVARQQGYSEYQHFDETLYGGDFLADQGPVLEMTNYAPKIIDLLDRMGVPFNRTAEGFRDLRLFGGSLFKRTHFSGATTGQQLLYALDEQVRRYEHEGRVVQHEFWEFLWPVMVGEGEERRCVGIVAQDMRTMQVRAFRADAVVMATGGCGLVFGKSTNSVICTGGAASRCYQAGAWYANPEMIQIHPTAIPGADKLRLMSESARGEGGRVWVPRKKGDTRAATEIPEKERLYFLEEKYPDYGNLVPRDIASREIFDICVNQGMGLGGGNMVYLDLTHMDPEYLTRKLGGIMEIYEKFAGDDPRVTPMKIFPGMHYSMGGLWTTYAAGSYTPAEPHSAHHAGDAPPVGVEVGMGMRPGAIENSRTNVEGLYAFGEVNFAYHGATRLGANALLSCIFDGLFCGQGVVNYVQSGDVKSAPASGVDARVFDGVVAQEEAKVERLIGTVDASADADDATNPYKIGQELGIEMTESATVVKTGERLQTCLARLGDLRERYSRVRLADSAVWTNQTLSYTRALGDMLILAQTIAKGSVLREESRGSHYRLDFPKRDDVRFHKTTVFEFHADTDGAGGDGHRVFYRDVRAELVKLRARTYGKSGGEVKKSSENKSAVGVGSSQ